MNVTEFNKIIYKGNVNKDFYLFCLRKNKRLIKYFFLNIYYLFLSLLFNSKKDFFETNKYKYLKEVSNLEQEIKEFYQNYSFNLEIELKNTIIVDRVLKLLIPKHLSKNIIGYELNENFTVKIEDYKKEVSKIKTANNLYIRSKYNLKNITFNKLFVVKHLKAKNVVKRKLINPKTKNLIIMFLLAFILTIISFFYTSFTFNLKMFITYFEPRLFLLNFFIFFLIILFLAILTKRIHYSFLITSIMLFFLGIANQTKILYRDDIVKFEDLTIIKEALIMAERYAVVIKCYTIIFLVFVIIIFFVLKRFVPIFKYNILKQVCFSIGCLIIILVSYKFIYQNNYIYNRVGYENIINKWIETRKYQIRGLVYPFVYTIEDIIDAPPFNYNEENARKILNSYEYDDLAENKKVNIIAVMLEAYNDFSKFGVIDFNEDIYEPFHKIQNNSISGNLVTTIFGGGTIVTERNFLTGFYEHPKYRKPTNSYARYFKEQGYKVEAMHPIYGAFYNRITADMNMGFDYYYNYENTFSKIQENFLTDYDFFDYIIQGYEKSKKENLPYFNFSVTYQNHGPYNSENYSDKEFYFDNKGYNEEGYNIINEYFHGIKNTNIALEKLINYFETEEEPTIIILFGDHNPFLGDENLIYNELGINLDVSTIEGFKNYYETPYIIHGNKKARTLLKNKFKGTSEDISPMFLMNKVFNILNEKGNEYLQYTYDFIKKVDVVSNNYYKENQIFVPINESQYYNLVNEYINVNYYWSRQTPK